MRRVQLQWIKRWSDMDDDDIVSHLLDVESKAYTLVAEAQAEADRRAAERAKKLRVKYDQLFAKRRDEMALRHQEEADAAIAEHDDELASYRQDLKHRELFIDKFQTVMKRVVDEAGRD